MSTGGFDWLLEKFRNCSDKQCLISDNRNFSYNWLLDEIFRWQQRLDQAGISPGRVIALEGDYSPAFTALFTTLMIRGDIVVPLAAGAATQRKEYLEIAEVQTLVQVDGCDGKLCDVRPDLPQNPVLRKMVDNGQPGMVLFSSGSTGKSKAALHNLSQFMEKFRPQRPAFVTLAFLMPDHIGGINTMFHVLSNAGTLVCITNRNPSAVCDAVDRYGVELLPTSPTFLNLLLLSEAYKRFTLSSLRRITYGTEVMPQRTLDRLTEILPQVQLQQTYGLSELGIFRSKSPESRSLWVRVGREDAQMKVQDGILWVKTESAMVGYLNAPCPFDSEGWFNTGDAVDVDGNFIRIVGRMSDVINVGGEKVFPVEIENVLLQMTNVAEVTVTGEANPITGQMVVARFTLLQPEHPSGFRQRMRDFCRDKLARYKVPAKVEIVTGEQHNARFKTIRRAGTLLRS